MESTISKELKSKVGKTCYLLIKVAKKPKVLKATLVSFEKDSQMQDPFETGSKLPEVLNFNIGKAAPTWYTQHFLNNSKMNKGSYHLGEMRLKELNGKLYISKYVNVFFSKKDLAKYLSQYAVDEKKRLEYDLKKYKRIIEKTQNKIDSIGVRKSAADMYESLGQEFEADSKEIIEW